ncbi:hypothetical protein HNW13_018010 [Shewanella sp. BF02_Schw]|uniref:hypothetical protein n=1 Tax=Shewanella sp. BF02_Schw TaxID=394908 RepID=UPI00177FCCA5|nr:hypothetical protein [Shewanella sp. BF02_Schw]MBO1897635.1 hypothetical protein [Shewanella sp. BF02_Schw]
MELILTGTLLTKKLDPEISYVLENVLAPKGIKYPTLGVTLYHGFTTSTTSMAHAFKKAVSQGLEIHAVSLELSVERSESLCSLEDIGERSVLNVTKMKKDLSHYLKDQWTSYLKLIPGAWTDAVERGHVNSSNELKINGFIASIGEHPYLLDSIWQLPELKHLSVILYTVIEDGQIANRATMFRRDRITMDETGVLPNIVVARYPEVDIQLPSYIL